MTSVLKLKNVEKTYSMDGIKVPVLKGVNAEIRKGEFISVLGPSGSGKSTLLHMMGLLDLPTSGELYVAGLDTKKLNENEIAKLRGEKIGFIFQFFNLHPALTALENVELPGIIVERDNEERAIELLETVGLKERKNHLSSQLSGGERQRVAIARALMNNPSLVLADEPTGNLDSKSGEQVINMLYGLNQQTGVTMIIVTHDTRVARRTERVIGMKDGRIVKDEVK